MWDLWDDQNAALAQKTPFMVRSKEITVFDINVIVTIIMIIIITVVLLLLLLLSSLLLPLLSLLLS